MYIVTQYSVWHQKIGPSSDDISKHNYREWPLFREYRKSEGFLKVFEEVFKEPFQLVDIDAARFKTPSENFLKLLAKISSEEVPEKKQLINILEEGIFGTLTRSSIESVQIVETEILQPENQADDGLQEP